jgi:hypothetical protein
MKKKKNSYRNKKYPEPVQVWDDMIEGRLLRTDSHFQY